ncbi:peptidyl-prolyl cis-trans isomerase [Bacteroides sedimenti]|uniref:Peptidyl-prolyl cis-trans isomerase n=2 Tax=Bacteroides sedimenti TaxID=2136147 RepID=A0ABM8I8Z0_9BACE
MKKLLLLVAVLCMQSNVMELNAQTVKSAQKKNKVTEKKVKGDTPKMAPTVSLNNQLDSIAYTIGMAQTQGLKNYLVNNLKMDTAYINEFIKGLNEGVKKLDKKQEALQAGVQIGQQIKKQMIVELNKEIFGADSTKTISVDHFMAGFIAGTLEKDQKMTMEQAQEYARTNMEALKNKSTEQTYGANKEAGAKFLAENKLKEGVVTTASGLQYKVITKGSGEIPTAESKVKVHYKGTTIDGAEFDSSYKRNEPATFEAGQVIKGWTEALTMMPVGSKWILYIPQELGYGSREAGPIKPFSTLIFEVELLSIEK